MACQVTQDVAAQLAQLRKEDFGPLGLRNIEPHFASGRVTSLSFYQVAYELISDVYVAVVQHIDDNPFYSDATLLRAKSTLSTVVKSERIGYEEIQKKHAELYGALEKVLDSSSRADGGADDWASVERKSQETRDVLDSLFAIDFEIATELLPDPRPQSFGSVFGESANKSTPQLSRRSQSVAPPMNPSTAASSGSKGRSKSTEKTRKLKTASTVSATTTNAAASTNAANAPLAVGPKPIERKTSARAFSKGSRTVSTSPLKTKPSKSSSTPSTPPNPADEDGSSTIEPISIPTITALKLSSITPPPSVNSGTPASEDSAKATTDDTATTPSTKSTEDATKETTNSSDATAVPEGAAPSSTTESDSIAAVGKKSSTASSASSIKGQETKTPTGDDSATPADTTQATESQPADTSSNTSTNPSTKPSTDDTTPSTDTPTAASLATPRESNASDDSTISNSSIGDASATQGDDSSSVSSTGATSTQGSVPSSPSKQPALNSRPSRRALETIPLVIDMIDEVDENGSDAPTITSEDDQVLEDDLSSSSSSSESGSAEMYGDEDGGDGGLETPRLESPTDSEGEDEDGEDPLVVALRMQKLFDAEEQLQQQIQQQDEEEIDREHFDDSSTEPSGSLTHSSSLIPGPSDSDQPRPSDASDLGSELITTPRDEESA